METKEKEPPKKPEEKASIKNDPESLKREVERLKELYKKDLEYLDKGLD